MAKPEIPKAENPKIHPKWNKLGDRSAAGNEIMTMIGAIKYAESHLLGQTHVMGKEARTSTERKFIISCTQFAKSRDLSGGERDAIMQFSLLWSLFEARVLDTNGNANERFYEKYQAEMADETELQYVVPEIKLKMRPGSLTNAGNC